MTDKSNKSIERVFRSYGNFTIAENRKDGEADAVSLLVVGTPVVFNTPAVIYSIDGIDFHEVIDRKAFDGADVSDFIFNFNHGGRVYARTRNETLKHWIDDEGLHCEVSLNPEDEGHKQLYHDIKSGLLDRMSFSFSVADDDYNQDTRTRTILKVKRLYDVSVVDFPAYEETQINARSFFEVEHSKELAEQEQRFERERLRAKALTYY